MPTGVVIAVDVGNSRVKMYGDVGGQRRRHVLPAESGALEAALRPAMSAIAQSPVEGHTERTSGEWGSLPQQARSCEFGLGDLAACLSEPLGQPVSWWVSSVNPGAASQLERIIRQARPKDRWQLIDASMIPLPDRLANRLATGVDRLLAAWFASRFLGSGWFTASGAPSSGMIVVDAGSAVTVDWVDGTGTFRGGMIYPGFALAARSLPTGTAALPDITLDPTAHETAQWGDVPLGREIFAAIRAGLYWSQWGGLRGAIEALQHHCRRATQREVGDATPDTVLVTGPDIVVTGGGIAAFRSRLPETWRWEPDLMAQAIFQLAALDPFCRPAAEV